LATINVFHLQHRLPQVNFGVFNILFQIQVAELKCSFPDKRFVQNSVFNTKTLIYTNRYAMIILFYFFTCLRAVKVLRPKLPTRPKYLASFGYGSGCGSGWLWLWLACPGCRGCLAGCASWAVLGWAGWAPLFAWPG
jgi:hypothetical protein